MSGPATGPADLDLRPSCGGTTGVQPCTSTPPTVSGPPARWVLAGGRAHLLAGERPGGVLVARCGHRLPMGVLQHERLPSRYLCQECFTAYLLPEPGSGVKLRSATGTATPPSRLPAVGRPPILLPSRARLATGRTGHCRFLVASRNHTLP
ncbi:MAG: hypothetical protein ACRDTA_12155 [Pseudonocardiaceae bacterium]